MFVCFVVFLVEKIKSKRVLSTYYPNEDHLSDLQQDQNIDSQSEEEVFETLDWEWIVQKEIDSSQNNLDSPEIIVSQMTNPDDATREREYWERFWVDVEYSKKRNKWNDYEKKLIEWLALDSYRIDVLKTLADYYFTYNQTKKSLPLLKKILDDHPEDHKTLRQMAEIYLEWGDLETSELLVNKAIHHNAENPKYAITLVEIYYNTGRLDEAIQSMEEVIRRRPWHTGYREALAKLYEEADDYDLVQECCQAIIEIDPNNIKAKKKVLELRNKQIV